MKDVKFAQYINTVAAPFNAQYCDPELAFRGMGHVFRTTRQGMFIECASQLTAALEGRPADLAGPVSLQIHKHLANPIKKPIRTTPSD